MKKVTHAKMKPKQTQAIKELQQSAMLNEVALAAGVKMLMQIHPNDQDFGTAVREGITKGMDIIDSIGSVETGQADKPINDITIKTITIK